MQPTTTTSELAASKAPAPTLSTAADTCAQTASAKCRVWSRAQAELSASAATCSSSGSTSSTRSPTKSRRSSWSRRTRPRHYKCCCRVSRYRTPTTKSRYRRLKFAVLSLFTHRHVTFLQEKHKALVAQVAMLK